MSAPETAGRLGVGSREDECVWCATEVFEILERFAGGPRDGWPIALGALLPHGRQFRLRLATGEVVPVPFCQRCADQLGPADSPDTWGVVWALALEAMRRRAVRVATMAAAELGTYQLVAGEWIR